MNKPKVAKEAESTFDRSISKHMKIVDRLMEMERGRKERVELNNSMNHLLAAEMITFRQAQNSFVGPVHS